MARLVWILIVMGAPDAGIMLWSAPSMAAAQSGAVAEDPAAVGDHACVDPQDVPCPPDPCCCDGLCGAALLIMAGTELAFDAEAYLAAAQSAPLTARPTAAHGPPRIHL